MLQYVDGIKSPKLKFDLKFNRRNYTEQAIIKIILSKEVVF